MDAVNREIEKQAPQYAALRNPRPSTLAEARAALADNEVALLYVLGSPRSYVVLVEGRPARGDRTEGLAIVELPPEDEIAEAVTPLQDSNPLTQPARVRTLGAAAYEMLLEPLADRLRGKDLVIVPSGDLSYLAFELLQEPAGKQGEERYLIEGRRVRYAPSLTSLHLLGQWKKKRPAPDRGLWALADPIYDGKDPRFRGRGGARVGGTFPRLPNTDAEVRAIAELLKADGATVLVGDQATEANVRKASASGELARARYVHFATHGVLGVGMGRQPGLVLGHVGGGVEPGGEDGYLDMEEVLGLRLNADLVVLSACRSYDGAMHNGEGVRGLARAFLCAGSKGVVCSLWAVEDRATAEFMAEFYRRVTGGATAADALCQTKRSMIRRGKLPLHWAAFVLVGE